MSSAQRQPKKWQPHTHLVAGEAIQLIGHRIRQRSDQNDAIRRELALFGGRQHQARVLARGRHHVQLLVHVAALGGHLSLRVREAR